MTRIFYKYYIITIVYSLFSFNCLAKVELLETKSMLTSLATKSVLTSLTKKNSHNILVVGEHGLIINWQNKNNFKQEISPVSVPFTDITILPNGLEIAVGHDGAIITHKNNSENWTKSFDGFQLNDFKITSQKQQIEIFKKKIASITNEDEKEEAEYTLEDLQYSLEDMEGTKETGPTLPLLSVTHTIDNKIIATGAYGTLLISDDLAHSWRLIDTLLDNPDNFHLNDIISTDKGYLYIVGENGIGFKSVDNSESWVSMDIPYNGSLFGIISQENSPNLIAFGLQGNYFTSSDNGLTWQRHNIGNSASILGGDITKNGDVYLVGHGGLIINFNTDTPTKRLITNHVSGSAFSDIIIDNNILILAGQFGITSLEIPKGLQHND